MKGGKNSLQRRPPVNPASQAWMMIFSLLLVIGLAIMFDYQRRSQNVIPEQPIPGRFWGNPDAELRITEFWDLYHPEGVRGERLIERYLLTYPDEIFFQTRYFPQDEKSLLITLYAECANRQQKFRPFLHQFFQKQFQWVAFSHLTPILRNTASQLGLNLKELSKCVESEDAAATVSLDRVYGESLFVHSTPTYFLNGRPAPGVKALEQALELWEKQYLENE